MKATFGFFRNVTSCFRRPHKTAIRRMGQTVLASNSMSASTLEFPETSSNSTSVKLIGMLAVKPGDSSDRCIDVEVRNLRGSCILVIILRNHIGGPMTRSCQRFLISSISLSILFVSSLNAAARWSIGLTANDGRIEAMVVAGSSASVPTVLLIGGLGGPDSTVDVVAQEASAFDALPQARRPFRLIALSLANPDGRPLQFPPAGVAYKENAESHVLWRWIGIHAPDIVLIAGESDSGLAGALSQNSVGFVGKIPSRVVPAKLGILQSLPSPIAVSEAHAEINRRRSRSPREFAEELGKAYGHDFAQPTYILDRK